MDRNRFQYAKHCPDGYRLLVQLFNEKTEKQARATLVRMFGEKKGKDARLERGTWQPLNMASSAYTSGEWVYRPHEGWRSYLRLDYGHHRRHPAAPLPHGVAV